MSTSRVWLVDALQAAALVTVLSLALHGPVYLVFARSHLLEAPLADFLLGEVPGWRELLGGGLVTLGMITALGLLPQRFSNWDRSPASTGGR